MSDTTSVVVVDRISLLGVKPDYCIHGETLCVRCGKGCWLGTETMKLVMEGAQPICLYCIKELHAEGLLPDGPTRHVDDHLRKDGPHE